MPARRDDTAADVRLVDLRKTFGEVTAVDGVSIDIRAGEFFSLLGPSGCGKTTTLRMIGGFEMPTGGQILLRGQDITNDAPERRPVNMVFQSYALFPHLTVFENVAFGLRRRGTDKPEITRRVGAALELVRLPDFGGRKPDQLSGGQQQRVALARALVCEPTVLLLDEPLGALDLKLRRQLQVELKRIQLEVGITFIYVTHDQEEALALSDRIAVMRVGRVEQLGSPEELYDRPATRFVAGFIGTSNLLAGTIESVEPGGVVIRLEGGEHCVAAGGLAVGTPVDLAIRPEAITIVPDDQSMETDGPVPALRGRVLQSAYLGTSVSHQVRTDGGLVLSVVVPRSVERPAQGDRVRLDWEPSDVLVIERAAETQTQEEERR
ncbi:MAG: ABC transporter ATP-binding protein [Chloroflexi bacterium]|nr:ABC transporter ATP-binding protein [Chloroflexota bacterium]